MFPVVAPDRQTLVNIVCGKFTYAVESPLGRPSIADVINAKRLFTATTWDDGFRKLSPEEKKAKLNEFFDNNPEVERWFAEEVKKNGTKGVSVLSAVMTKR